MSKRSNKNHGPSTRETKYIVYNSSDCETFYISMRQDSFVKIKINDKYIEIY